MLIVIITLLRLIPRSEKRQEMMDMFLAIENQTRLKIGCVSCAIYEQCSDEHAILYLDQWESKAQLDRHIQSGLYLWVLTAMELASEPPEISFHQVSDTKGLEFIESLRTTLKE
jgi:quinol monooxygenase YgiN